MANRVKKHTSNNLRQLHICQILESHKLSLEEFLSALFYKDADSKREYVKLIFPTFDEDRINFLLKLYRNKNVGLRIVGAEKSYVEAINHHYNTFINEFDV